MGRLRRREIIPEDTPIVATLNEPKIIHGQFGRQVQTQTRVIEGEYKGTEFRTWFSFGKDNETAEEFIPHGGPLHSVLSLADPDIDAFLESDESLSEKKYESRIKKAVAQLAGVTIIARVGVKASKANPDKRSNVLQPGTIGPFEDPDEATDREMEQIPF